MPSVLIRADLTVFVHGACHGTEARCIEQLAEPVDLKPRLECWRKGQFTEGVGMGL